MKSNLIVTIFSLGAAISIGLIACELANAAAPPQTLARPPQALLMKRSTPGGDSGPHGMMHSHLSRKVFERACAASKDTINEIISCLTSNEHMMKALDPEKAAKCYKDSFGIEFKPGDVMKHKELICSNRDKFEQLASCVYHKTAENMDPKQMEMLTEAMVDVGLCIINAIDG